MAPSAYPANVPYLKYLKHPLAWDEITIISTFEDMGQDYNTSADTPPQRWDLQYDGLTMDQAGVLDQHYDSAMGQVLGFNFTEPRDDAAPNLARTYEQVHYEKYERDHRKSWNQSRTVTLVKRFLRMSDYLSTLTIRDLIATNDSSRIRLTCDTAAAGAEYEIQRKTEVGGAWTVIADHWIFINDPNALATQYVYIDNISSTPNVNYYYRIHQHIPGTTTYGSYSNEAWANSSIINYALPYWTLGISASSYADGYNPKFAANGSRIGANDDSHYWKSNTSAPPHSFIVNFNTSRDIAEINVFTAQQSLTSWVPPTLSDVFSQNGAVNYDVEFYNGSVWALVENGHITGNNKVWRQLRFTAATVAMQQVRVTIFSSSDNVGRLVEVECLSARTS
jgi:hypothetical protein